MIPVSQFVRVAFSDYSAFDEVCLLLQQPFAFVFLTACAIVHLLRPVFFFRTILSCAEPKILCNYFLITAFMRRMPALLLSSLTILKLTKSAVFCACGPPQISIDTSPIE